MHFLRLLGFSIAWQSGRSVPRMEDPAVLPMWMKTNVPLTFGRMMGLVTIVVLVMVLLLGTVALMTLLTVFAATVAL